MCTYLHASLTYFTHFTHYHYHSKVGREGRREGRREGKRDGRRGREEERREGERGIGWKGESEAQRKLFPSSEGVKSVVSYTFKYKSANTLAETKRVSPREGHSLWKVGSCFP